MKDRVKTRLENEMVREETAEYGGSAVVPYRAADGMVSLDVRLERETVWLSLNQIAAVFGRDKSVISRHLRNVFWEGELDWQSTGAFFAAVQEEGAAEFNVISNISISMQSSRSAIV